jgi:hypothetical protein
MVTYVGQDSRRERYLRCKMNGNFGNGRGFSVSEPGLRHVRIFDIADGTVDLFNIGRHASIALSTDLSGPSYRCVLSNLGLPLLLTFDRVREVEKLCGRRSDRRESQPTSTAPDRSPFLPLLRMSRRAPQAPESKSRRAKSANARPVERARIFMPISLTVSALTPACPATAVPNSLSDFRFNRVTLLGGRVGCHGGGLWPAQTRQQRA